MTDADPLLRPFTLGSLLLKNRVVSTPHAPAYADRGMPGERYQRYHEEKARGGLAMTMFGGSSCIAKDSPSVFGQLYVGEDAVIPYFEQFSERIHQHDCALICQISHLGRRTVWNNGDWLPVIAPSRVREPAHRAFPKAMEQHDIDRVIADYANAARRCKSGGLDGCEVLSQGHLPGQFVAAFSNQRTDQYGGSLENRLRFTLQLLEAIRKSAGDDFILGLRAEMVSGTPDGLAEEECLRALELVQQEGLINYVSLNFGRIDTDYNLSRQLPAMWSKLAPWLQLAGHFKQALDLPVMHACRVADIANARYAIDAEMVDLIGMTRAHIADPHLVNKLASGQEHRIRPCVGASYCIDRIYQEGEALCLHNAATGREATMPQVIEALPKPLQRKVVIVGGGPAGLEAARVCASKGHATVLLEASDRLGGQLQVAALASWRKDLKGIVDWYINELTQLAVDVQWNVLADGDNVRQYEPDVVIVATGGIPDTDFVPGGELAISVWDALDGAALSGDVLIYDDNGQHQAPSCADTLAESSDTTVEIVSTDRHVAADMGGINYPEYLKRLYKKGVVMTPDHRLREVRKSGNRLLVTFDNTYEAGTIERLVDHLIVEHGTLPMHDLFFEMIPNSCNKGVTDIDALVACRRQPISTTREAGFELYRIGDCVASRNVHAAIYDALRLCIAL